MFKSWKTTLAGLASIATGVISFSNGETMTGITAIIAGVGLLLGKDFNVSGQK